MSETRLSLLLHRAPISQCSLSPALWAESQHKQLTTTFLLRQQIIFLDLEVKGPLQHPDEVLLAQPSLASFVRRHYLVPQGRKSLERGVALHSTLTSLATVRSQNLRKKRLNAPLPSLGHLQYVVVPGVAGPVASQVPECHRLTASQLQRAANDKFEK